MLTVYEDSLGIETIGIGRNLKDRGITKEELEYMDIPSMDVVYEHGITEADARYLAMNDIRIVENELCRVCLLYTSPSPRDGLLSRMPSSA